MHNGTYGHFECQICATEFDAYHAAARAVGEICDECVDQYGTYSDFVADLCDCCDEGETDRDHDDPGLRA